MKDHFDSLIAPEIDDMPDYSVPDYSEPLPRLKAAQTPIASQRYVNSKVRALLTPNSPLMRTFSNHTDALKDLIQGQEDLSKFLDDMNERNKERNARIAELEATNAHLVSRIKRLEGFFTTNQEEE